MTGFLDHLVSRSAPSTGHKPTEEILQPRLPSLFELQAGTSASLTTFREAGSLLEGEKAKEPSERNEDGIHQLNSVSASSDEAHEPQMPFTSFETHYPSAMNKSAWAKDIVQTEYESNHPNHWTGDNHFDQQKRDAVLLHAFEPGNTSGQTPVLSPPSVEMEGHHPEQGKVLISTNRTQMDDESSMRSSHLEPVQPAQLSESGNPYRLVDGKFSLLVPITSSVVNDDFQTPTVHINIGRIEVRAVTQTAQSSAQKPAMPRPKLTLDEYLRQRNEGKR